jgi:hypothetical protein
MAMPKDEVALCDALRDCQSPAERVVLIGGRLRAGL